MENFGANDERPKNECLRLINNECDIFVGIYAHRYGFIPKGDNVSITEAEYRAATSAGIPRLIYIVDEKTPWVLDHVDKGGAAKKLLKLKSNLKLDHTCGFFSNKDQLAAKVVADLGRHFSLRALGGADRVAEQRGAASNRKKSGTVEEWSAYRQEVFKANRGVYLVHVISPSKAKGQTFDISVYLLKHYDGDLSEVDRAEFFLGRYWDNRIFSVKNGGGPIGISISAYGPFLCTCRVVFKDGHESYINRYIDFEMEDVIKQLPTRKKARALAAR
jgi:hypothetical protein